MKGQWRSISMDQEDRFSAFRERKTQIEKDVSRTDRSHPFFAGEGNKYIDLLQDILMTYIMYDFDLGYVQVLQFFINSYVRCEQRKILLADSTDTNVDSSQYFRECLICFHQYFL